EVPPGVENLVARAMARDLGWRFPDVPSLIRSLEDLMRNSWTDTPIGSQDSSAGVSGDSARVPRPQLGPELLTARVFEPRPRRTVFVVASVVAALAVVIMVVGLSLRRRRVLSDERLAGRQPTILAAPPLTARPDEVPPTSAVPDRVDEAHAWGPGAGKAPVANPPPGGAESVSATATHSRGKPTTAVRASKSAGEGPRSGSSASPPTPSPP
ncbi:MAG: hypothetical protein ABUS79_25225, partial [Pseudomonadota bacterium]